MFEHSDSGKLAYFVRWCDSIELINLTNIFKELFLPYLFWPRPKLLCTITMMEKDNYDGFLYCHRIGFQFATVQRIFRGIDMVLMDMFCRGLQLVPSYYSYHAMDWFPTQNTAQGEQPHWLLQRRTRVRQLPTLSQLNMCLGSNPGGDRQVKSS